jgi:hypothetical protein
MPRLHRIHAGFIIGAAVLRTLRSIAFTLLVIAGLVWLIERSFTGRNATVLVVCVGLWGLRAVIRAIGAFLGPPEPMVNGGTQLEKRRALRRAQMLGRW